MKRIIGIMISMVVLIGFVKITDAIQTNTISAPIVGQQIDHQPLTGVDPNNLPVATSIKDH